MSNGIVELNVSTLNILHNTYLRGVGSLTTYSQVQWIINELFRICAQVKADWNGRRGFDAGPSDV